MTFSRIHVPAWAGIMFGFLFVFLINDLLLPAIPFLEALPKQGFMPYLTSGAGVLGIWFAMRGSEELADRCAGMATASGLLGTSVGFITYLMSYGTGQPDRSGMKFAFLSTAHGLLFLLLIEFLLLWPRAADARSRQ